MYYTKHWVHLKCSKLQQRTTTTYGTALQHLQTQNTNKHNITKIFSKSCNSMQMASATKQMKYNYSLKVHKQMSLQYKRLNSINPAEHQTFITSHLSEQIVLTNKEASNTLKTTSVLHNYISKLTVHFHPNNLPNYTNRRFNYISTLTTITNLPNTIITADVNAHSSLWYSPTEDHRGELIEDILLNSNHITLNTNTPTRLPPNQTQQPTSPDITTASANLHDHTSWQTVHSLTSDHLPLLTTISIHNQTKTTHHISLKQ